MPQVVIFGQISLHKSPEACRCNTKQTMKNIKQLTLFASAGVLLAFAAVFANPDESRETLDLAVDHTPINRSAATGPVSYAPMLEKAQETVVAVYTADVVRVVRSSATPQDDMLRRFFGLPAPRGREEGSAVEERRVPQGVGSGVIVREDGYIITNNHVVSDQRGEAADEVLVRLNDGRELSAEIVGRDPKTDVAVLKVEATGLPAAPIADSEEIKVGDIVFAIGNPMGIGLTVTSGIVSATDRAIGIYGRDGYEDFIQTDASINQGNSGGALVDVQGRLIGINSAILSRSGGNIGIGFAIPSNLAVNITRQLTESGEVQRGFIGVSISELTPDMAEAFGLDSTKGVLIEEVIEGLPAEKAGLERGDVIVKIDGKIIESSNELRLEVAQRPPGSSLEVLAVRDGKKKTFSINVGDQSNKLGSTGDELVPGVNAAPVDEATRRELGLPGRLSGLTITKVDPTSRYARRLTEGMVILEINDQQVNSLSDGREAMRQGANKLYVYHEGRTGYLAVRVK